jgi:APA family basic amino acid/polyamine antiporter
MGNETVTTTPKKNLSLLDSSMLIMGSMIGSGIFIVSAGIAREVQSPGLLLLVWIVTGIMTIFGALSYGELAAAMPQAGGQYVYLKEAYNPLVGFLYGWTLFAVIQTGTIAAVGVAFAKFTGVFFKGISDTNYILSIGSFHISTQQALGIACVILLTLSNFRSVKAGAFVQNLFTFSKIAALLGLILLGFLFGGNADTTSVASHFAPAFPDSFSFSMIGIFFASMVGSVFSADAWNNITFTAGEVENPQRNLPLSLVIGTGVVIGLYILANVVYLYVLPIESIQTAPADRVATLVMQTILGSTGLYFMAFVVMISTFGCLNGLILAGARVYYAMAIDKLFFKPASQLNVNGVPAKALVFQCIWACLLTLTGSYNDLLDYVVFAVLLFYILTIIGIFILRKTQPDMPRPYRAVGYPMVPAVYIILASSVCISLLTNKPFYSFIGLLIVLLGIPLYFLAKRNLRQQTESDY